MELLTKRLRLRQWRASDREPFARINSDGLVMKYFAAALSEEESDRFAAVNEAHIEEHGWGLWAIEVPDVAPFAGFVGLSTPRFDAHFTPCTEVGWRLAPAFWGRGYATEGARAVLAFGFERLGLQEIVSFTTEANMPSRRVMERVGMTHDPGDDFDYPALPPGHPLRHHVLYRKLKGSE